MRAILVIGVFLTLAGFGVWWVLGIFDRKSTTTPDPAPAEVVQDTPPPQPAQPTPPPLSPRPQFVQEDKWSLGDPDKFFMIDELDPEHPQEYDFGYEPPAPRPRRKSVVLRFMNRLVPQPRTAFTEGAGGSETVVTIDEVANAWIVTGYPERIDDYRQLAEQLDIPIACVDLDLVLVAISEERLKALGITSSFLEGATWLNSFDLGFSTAGLQLVLDDGYIRVDLEDSDDSVSVVSMPTIRVVTGEEFQFGDVDQVPIATLSVTEQSETTTFTYRDVGLQFSGLLSVIGNRWFLKFEQEQGTVVGEDNGPDSAPRFRTSNSKTTLTVDLDTWSPASGLLIERKVWRRGILSKRDEHRRDLVLVFVRPRTYLQRPLRGLPAGPPLEDLGAGVLPPLPVDSSK